MLEIREEFYHGWVIQVTQQPSGYTFQCWMADQMLGITDARYYLTMEQAFRAGQWRADLESVRLSLTNFLHGKLQRLLLNPDERDALENSITQYIDVAKHRFS